MTSKHISIEELPARPTIKQATEFTGLSDRTIRNYLAAGTLTGYRVGTRNIRIDRDSLVALVSKPLRPSAD